MKFGFIAVTITQIDWNKMSDGTIITKYSEGGDPICKMWKAGDELQIEF